MLHVNFKTEEDNKILVALDDKCPMGLVRIDTTLSEHNLTMPVDLESFKKITGIKDLWLSEFTGYCFIDGDVLYNTITSMYENDNFAVNMNVMDIQKNIVDTITLETSSIEDDHDKFSKRKLNIQFNKYDTVFSVKMKDIISALEIVTYKKE